MTSNHVGTKVARFFDGRDWRDDVVLNLDDAPPDVPLAFTPLVDGFARVFGELPHPRAGRPFGPMENYAMLLDETPVRRIVDVGDRAALRDYLRSTSTTGLQVAWKISIDAAPAMGPDSMLVRTSADVDRVVDYGAATGAIGILAGPHLSAELLRSVVEAGRGHGLDVAHIPGEVSAVEALQMGVATVISLGRVVTNRDAGPIDGIAELSEEDLAARAESLGEALVSAGASLMPLLLAQRRQAVIEEIVNEPALPVLAQIAPFHSHLLKFQSGPAMTFGKKYAREYLGIEPMKSFQRKSFEQGWERLLEAFVRLQQGGVKLEAGSSALSVSLAPGSALVEELEIWEQAGLDVETILRAGTQKLQDQPASVFVANTAGGPSLTFAELIEGASEARLLPDGASAVGDSSRNDTNTELRKGALS